MQKIYCETRFCVAFYRDYSNAVRRLHQRALNNCYSAYICILAVAEEICQRCDYYYCVLLIAN